jgi:hypothetical protein
LLVKSWDKNGSSWQFPIAGQAKIRIISILVHISGKVLFSGVFEMITFLRTGAWIWTEEIEMDENGI